MELSSTGRISVWLAVALSIFGAIFTNPAALGISIIVALYLIYEGLSFRRIARGTADLLKAETTPSEQETRAMTPVSLVTTITNESEQNLLLLDAKRILPVGVSENQSNTSVPYTLKPHAQLSLRSEIHAKYPGTFLVSKLELTLGSRRALFLDHIVIQDRFHMIVKPRAVKATHRIDTDNLADLIHDETRRGPGTDFAGLRPATYLDNYRLLDWKAVARFGKFYTREFYLDEEPAIMLMVDASLLAGVAGSLLLEELQKLITNLQAGSPLGLVIYDSKSIITTISPTIEYKDRVLRALVRNYGTKEEFVMQGADFGNEGYSLSRLLAFESATKRHLKRLGLFARTILPFYSYARSELRARLRLQGSYLAFERICSLCDPLVIISIANRSSSLEGLLGGANKAVRLNHKVILVLLSSTAEHLRSSGWRSEGIAMANSTPRNLVNTVNSEILQLGRARSMRVNR